jgi:hypothetical protein
MIIFVNWKIRPSDEAVIKQLLAAVVAFLVPINQ